MIEFSPLTPEARRKGGGVDERSGSLASQSSKFSPQHIISIAKRTAVGVYADGFTFAGNFAYLALLAVFSFFIVAAAIAGTIGQTAIGSDFVDVFLKTVPPTVAGALREPINDAMSARTGPLLWFSAAVGLWTTASLIETIREILHRAYGVEAQRAFWEYRLRSIGLIIASVFLRCWRLVRNLPLPESVSFWWNICRV